MRLNRAKPFRWSKRRASTGPRRVRRILELFVFCKLCECVRSPAADGPRASAMPDEIHRRGNFSEWCRRHVVRIAIHECQWYCKNPDRANGNPIATDTADALSRILIRFVRRVRREPAGGSPLNVRRHSDISVSRYATNGKRPTRALRVRVCWRVNIVLRGTVAPGILSNL